MKALAPGVPLVAGARVLVVDDDELVRQMIVDYLRDHDITVTALADGRQIERVLVRDRIDLVILDLKLPGEDGVQIACALRAQSDVALIVVTGRKDEADRVMCLELGADDYLTKPFSPRELLARVRALLRRTRARASSAEGLVGVRAYRFAGFELSVGLRRLARPGGDAVALTNNEFSLLVAFLTASRRVLTREQLLSLSRLHDDEVYDRSIDVQVARLRKKLGADTADPLIKTERGAGYLFNAEVEVLR
jgi:two-component system, OmpR family, response regulator